MDRKILFYILKIAESILLGVLTFYVSAYLIAFFLKMINYRESDPYASLTWIIGLPLLLSLIMTFVYYWLFTQRKVSAVDNSNVPAPQLPKYDLVQKIMFTLVGVSIAFLYGYLPGYISNQHILETISGKKYPDFSFFSVYCLVLWLIIPFIMTRSKWSLLKRIIHVLAILILGLLVLLIMS